MFIGVLLLAALVFYMIYIAIRIVFEGIRQASPGCLITLAIISIVILVSMTSLKAPIFYEIKKFGEVAGSIGGDFGFLKGAIEKVLNFFGWFFVHMWGLMQWFFGKIVGFMRLVFKPIEWLGGFISAHRPGGRP